MFNPPRKKGRFPLVSIWNADPKIWIIYGFFWDLQIKQDTEHCLFPNLCFGSAAEFATLGIVCCLVMASFFVPKRRHVMSPLYNEKASINKEKGGLSLGRGIL